MSVSLDSETDVIDYSDFQVQHVHSEVNVGAGGDNTNQNVTGLSAFDPLEDVGGLSNAEVAELVYLEVGTCLEYEDETADQNVATAMEHRGVVGANLREDVSELIRNSNSAGTAAVVDSNDPNNSDAATKSKTDNGTFLQFQHVGGLPFDDETNGPGGSATGDGTRQERHFRQMTGRGPVLDQTDTMSVMHRIITGDNIMSVAGNVKATMVWDISEIDDAERQFSVPM
jgi:hypothetical protein